MVMDTTVTSTAARTFRIRLYQLECTHPYLGDSLGQCCDSKVLASFGEFWRVLASFGEFWRVLRMLCFFALIVWPSGIVSACHRGDRGAMGSEIESRQGKGWYFIIFKILLFFANKQQSPIKQSSTFEIKSLKKADHKKLIGHKKLSYGKASGKNKKSR
jgi:hypothetical protein